MAFRAIGLDVGTAAVRAAEVSVSRGVVTLERFGQVAVPVGSVAAGEVVDPPAVATAIRRLWREAGFSSKQVVVGVGNQRVVVRQADLPDMPVDELRSAITFQAQELIPIPVEDAILDFQVLQQYTGRDGEPLVRVLLAAAQRDMVAALLAAVTNAGLEAVKVDLVPFALLRSLASVTFSVDPTAYAAGTAEALVCVGAGTTNIVVHEAGIPQFVRILTLGGGDLTDAVAEELHVPADVAVDLKRRANPLGLGDDERAARIVAGQLAPFLDEVRGSLDYYLAQGGEVAGLRGVVLTGAGSRIPGLAERLAGLLGVPVAVGDPLGPLVVGRTGLSDEQLYAARDVLAVPVGLALAAQSGESRRISLLPPDVAASRAERRQMVGAGAALAALASLLVALWLVRGTQVGAAADEAGVEESTTRQLQATLAGMGDVADVEAQIRQRQVVVGNVLDGEIAWSRLLQEIATVLPNDVWLTSFEGTAATADAPARLDIGAMGADQASGARWLMRVGELDAIGELWLPASTREERDGGVSVVSFQSTATLTPSAASDRLAAYLAEPGDDEADGS